jgi:hypothetical protein
MARSNNPEQLIPVSELNSLGFADIVMKLRHHRIRLVEYWDGSPAVTFSDAAKFYRVVTEERDENERRSREAAAALEKPRHAAHSSTRIASGSPTPSHAFSDGSVSRWCSWPASRATLSQPAAISSRWTSMSSGCVSSLGRMSRPSGAALK